MQQIEFVGQLKKLHYNDNVSEASVDLSMFVLTILEKNLRNENKIFLRKSTGLMKDSKKKKKKKARVKLTNRQLNKLKSAAAKK